MELVGIKTYTEDGFSLPDREAIEALVTDRTKAILITNPGNPTGKVYTKEEIEILRDVAAMICILCRMRCIGNLSTMAWPMSVLGIILKSVRTVSLWIAFPS